MKIKNGDTPELKLKKMDGSDFDLNNFKGKKVYLKYTQEEDIKINSAANRI